MWYTTWQPLFLTGRSVYLTKQTRIGRTLVTDQILYKHASLCMTVVGKGTGIKCIVLNKCKHWQQMKFQRIEHTKIKSVETNKKKKKKKKKNKENDGTKHANLGIPSMEEM